MDSQLRYGAIPEECVTDHSQRQPKKHTPFYVALMTIVLFVGAVFVHQGSSTDSTFKTYFAKTMEQADDADDSSYNLTITSRFYYNQTECLDEETAFPNSEITITKPADTCFKITAVDDSEGTDESTYFMLTCSDDTITLTEYINDECSVAFGNGVSYEADAYTCEHTEDGDLTAYTGVYTSSCAGVISDKFSTYSHSSEEEIKKFMEWRRANGFSLSDQLMKTGLTPTEEAYQLAKTAIPIVKKKLEDCQDRVNEIVIDLINQFTSPYVWEFMLSTGQSDMMTFTKNIEQSFEGKSSAEKQRYLKNVVEKTENKDRAASYSRMQSNLNNFATQNDRADIEGVPDDEHVLCVYASLSVSFLYWTASGTTAACTGSDFDDVAWFNEYGLGAQIGTIVGVDLSFGYQQFFEWDSVPGVSYSFSVSATADVMGTGVGVEAGIVSSNSMMTDCIGYSVGVVASVGVDYDAQNPIGASFVEGNAYCHSADFEYDCNEYTEDCCPSDDGGCFPGDATVILSGGERVRMDQLSLGDEVMTIDENTGARSFAPVYLFGHKDPASEAIAILLTVANGREIKATSGHYIPAAPRGVGTWAAHEMTRFGDITKGMNIWTATNNTIELTEVIAVKTSKARGLFNPFTRDGIIVVDDVVCSEYSEWFLDDVTPAAYRSFLPAIYHTIQAPLAWLAPYIPGPVGSLDAALSNGGPNFNMRAFVGSLLVVPTSV